MNNSGILIISSFIKFSDSLKKIMGRFSEKEVFTAVSLAEAQKIMLTHSVSSLIINAPLSDGFGLDFAVRCAKEKNYAVLMFLPAELYEQASKKAAQYGILTLSKPTSPDIVLQSVSLLQATEKKLSMLKKDTACPGEKIEELNMISRAKLILISSLGMTEARAHKFIEQRAMETRKTKTEIAKGIITSYGNQI